MGRRGPKRKSDSPYTSRQSRRRSATWQKWWDGLSPEKRAEQEEKRREKMRRFRARNPGYSRKFKNPGDFEKAKAIAREKELMRQQAEWAAFKQARLEEL